MLDSEGFDKWAELYDQGAVRCDEAGEYPFAGYRKILSEISKRILESGAEDVLDLGFGTGTLLKSLYDRGVRVYGQDYSGKMISIAREKMPEATLCQGDLREGLAAELRSRRYDAIVSTYALHHIPDEEKTAFLASLLPCLKRGGCIYIGDVAFETREDLERCREANGEEWDDEEVYFVCDEIRASFPAMRFEAMSDCGGLLTLENPVLMTERLVLRRWEEEDAEALFPLAADPDVGPNAGWPPHKDVEESRKIVRMFMKCPEHYAVCLREDGRLIGAAALHFGKQTDLTDRTDECELGYWIGKPFWGRGFMTEAAKELLRRAFTDCGVRAVWCGYYEGNERSRRVQEKCGFIYQWTSEDVDVPQMHEKRRGHVSRITKMEWFSERASDRKKEPKRNRMEYRHLDYEKLRTLCGQIFHGYGFTEEEAMEITDALLAADLFGIESHGIQRLVRYDYEITSGMVDIRAVPETVHETAVSATVDAHNAMGQLMGVRAMKMAIEKARKSGVGIVTVRNSNHFGMAGYYARMAVREGLIGVGMTNAEAIMVPTFGRQAMIGTNPIAFGMPAEPVPFVFDAATTVVPRGKLEVYAKRGNGIPEGWAVDENGDVSSDSDRVLKNIKAKTGGGILPLGGATELYGGHKGYGFGMICEICCAILSLGTTANYIYKTPGGSGICHFFMAADPAIFGDPSEIRTALSTYLQEIRASRKAEGADRIYIHGEKELEAEERMKKEGIPVNEKTLSEIREIAMRTGADPSLIVF